MYPVQPRRREPSSGFLLSSIHVPETERELRDGRRDEAIPRFNNDETTAIIILLLESAVSRCRHNHVGAVLCSCDSDRAHLCREHSLTAADIMAG